MRSTQLDLPWIYYKKTCYSLILTGFDTIAIYNVQDVRKLSPKYSGDALLWDFAQC